MQRNILCLSMALLTVAIVLLGCKKEEEDLNNPNYVNLSRDLLVHYTFDDGNCTDISGKGHNGVPIGVSFVNDTPTAMGLSAKIDGTQQQYINIPYELMTDSTGFSFSAWFKNFGPGPLFASIKDYRSAPGLFVTHDGKFSVCYYSDYLKEMNTSIIDYQSSGWHLITVTAKSRKEITVYIDGKKIDSNSVGDVRPSGKKIQIGGNVDGKVNGLAWADPMLIDNVRVYGRCISPKEAEEIYRIEGNTNGAINTSTTRGLLAYYTFDDMSANNHYLTGSNGTLISNGNKKPNFDFISDTPNNSGFALQLLQEQYINIANTMLNCKDACSIGFWIKDFGTGPIFTTIGNYLNTPSIYINNDSKPIVVYYSDYKCELRTELTNYQSSGWHHIFVTMCDKKEIVLYIDGIRINSESVGNVEGGGIKMQIGGNGDGKVNGWAWADPMKIDNVRIHSVALTEAEVRAIYDEERQ